MIRIKDYIFNENEIVKIQFDDGSKEMEIDHKNGNRTFIDGTFDDIEWNYDGTQKRTLNNTILMIDELTKKNTELEEENKKFDKIKKYIKDNEIEFGSLLDNEKTILRIIDGE